ncbi:type VI secretion system baseplate subunit TssF [Escherichia coli]
MWCQANISGAGFNELDTTLPRTGSVSYIHNLTLDYFSFPERFNFIDIKFNSGIDLFSGESFRIVITLKNSAKKYDLDKIEKIFSKDFFRINCVPVINLFNKKTEPLRLSEDIDEYQVNVDLYRRMKF